MKMQFWKETKSNRYKVLSLTLLYYFIVFLILPTKKANAHWIQTHQYMTRPLAMYALNKDKESPQGINNTRYFKFLARNDEAYLKQILKGTKDADQLFNGLYGIDCYCENYTKSCTADCYCIEECEDGTCEDVKYKTNINVWPVGDHGYNPLTKVGFYASLVDKQICRVEEMLVDNYGPVNELLDVIDGLEGIEGDTKLEKLKNLLKISNAAAMADFFYKRAQSEWENGHPVDAMYNLGISIHLVQDLSNPQHARTSIDPASLGGDGHIEYERKILVDEIGGKPVYGGDYYVGPEYYGDYENKYIRNLYPGLNKDDWYSDDMDANSWLERNANSWLYGNPEDFNNEDLKVSYSKRKSVRLGVESTVGMIISFFRSVNFCYDPVPTPLQFDRTETEESICQSYYQQYKFDLTPNGNTYTITVTPASGNPSLYYSDSQYRFSDLSNWTDCQNSYQCSSSTGGGEGEKEVITFTAPDTGVGSYPVYIAVYGETSVNYSIQVTSTPPASNWQYPVENWALNCNGFWGTCYMENAHHLGVDILVPHDTEVYAVADGKVKYVENIPTWYV